MTYVGLIPFWMQGVGILDALRWEPIITADEHAQVVSVLDSRILVIAAASDPAGWWNAETTGMLDPSEAAGGAVQVDRRSTVDGVGVHVRPERLTVDWRVCPYRQQIKWGPAHRVSWRHRHTVNGRLCAEHRLLLVSAGAFVPWAAYRGLLLPWM